MSLTIENGAAGDPLVGDDLPPPPAAAPQFVVIKQHVAIEVDLQQKSVHGVSTIVVFLIEPDLEEISLDARQCDIDVDNITVNGFKTKASFSDPYDLMQVPRQYQIGAPQHHIMARRMQPLRPLKRPEVPNSDRTALPCCVPADGSLKVSLKREYLSKPPAKSRQMPELARVKNEAVASGMDQNEAHSYKISIPFRSKNIRDGLHFVGVDEGDLRYPHVYTRHSMEPGTVSCIFPCVDDPGSRHPWELSIKCPRTLGDVFEQPTATQPSTTQALNPTRKRKHGEDPAPPPPPARFVEQDKLLEMTVVCSGNLTGEQIDPLDDKKKIMTFESSIAAAQHIAFAIGPFEHIQLWSEFRTEDADEKLGANAAKIHGYCLPNRAEEVLHACQPIVGAADYFAPEFGRYPFDSYKICFVEDMVPDTVSGTSISLCSTRLLYPEEIIDVEFEVTRKLVHALASQYFGVYIVPNRRSDNWLIVGIQWFMTDLFMKTICGNNWYRFHLKTLSDKLVEQDVSRPSLHDLGEHLHIGDFELEFMSLKAPLVLYILDQRMSKIPGSTGIVRVISKIVSTANIDTKNETTWLSAEQFRSACEKMSQYRPDELWNQWIYSAGCPKLDIKQKFNKKNLNVDITIEQKQGRDTTPKEITKEDFHRELVELRHDVWAGPVPKLFTGPFTVRIHEADGTPYEHYLAITDKDKNSTTLQIAYNTKYKRMKRTKKATAAAAANSAADKDPQEDDVVYYNALGDVLQTEKDAQDWGLQDWSQATQTQMDQESYEWIRLDCNFEWLCSMKTDMPPYMIVAQLQQDRDVVAQQDSMLYLHRTSRPSGVVSTIETRTAMDRRYYYGIRCMAIEDLPKMADPELNFIGKAHLILIFRHFFCDRMVAKNGTVTFPPMPNDFSDKAQYNVQCAMPNAIARTRENGRCSKDARNFLLDLILFNDNSENEYSDQFWVAKLLEALTTSLIPKKVEGERDLLSSLNPEKEADMEFKRFIEKTIEEIDKYRRMDEWTSTYQNIWTTTALECKMRLMKAKVIPVAPLEFVQYLQDDNIDLVRIKAFECLVELGMLSKSAIMKLLLSNVSTDPSPFVRDRLFKILCKGMAAIALGENKAQQVEQPMAIVEDDGFVIEQGEAEIQQRKLDATRNQSIQNTLAALKEELKGNEDLQLVFWKAVNSSWISAKETFNLLDLCSAMFEPDDNLLLTFQYPKVWRATREINAPPLVNGRPDPSRGAKKQCIIRFTTEYRTEPRQKRILEPPPPPQPEAAVKPPEPKKIKLSTKPSFSGASFSRQPSFSGPSASRPGTPQPLTIPTVSNDSIAVVSRVSVAQAVSTPATPRPSSTVVSDSIAVQRVSVLLGAPSTPKTATPPPPSSAAPVPPSTNGARPPAEKRPKPSAKKRKSDEGDDFNRPKKLKTENGRPSKIVTVPFRAWDRLPEKTRRQIREHKAANRPSSVSTSSTIVAKRPSALGGSSGGGLAKMSSSVNSSVRARTPTVGGRGSTPILLSRASPAPGSSRASPAPNRPGTPSLLSAAPKQRKPLPSAAPHHSPGGQSSSVGKSGGGSTGGGGSSGGGDAPPVKKKSVIKLKVRAPSQASPPPSGGQR